MVTFSAMLSKHFTYVQVEGHITAQVHCTPFHCTPLHCMPRQCTALHATALHAIALYYTAQTPLDRATLHVIALQYCTTRHCWTLHRTTCHCTARHRTAPHATACIDCISRRGSRLTTVAHRSRSSYPEGECRQMTGKWLNNQTLTITCDYLSLCTSCANSESIMVLSCLSSPLILPP